MKIDYINLRFSAANEQTRNKRRTGALKKKKHVYLSLIIVIVKVQNITKQAPFCVTFLNIKNRQSQKHAGYKLISATINSVQRQTNEDK